ncbi:hypothetical protein AB1Y20_012169 [Prymnesium parvum]|uniref:Mitochondrial carrier protein n=1 Tax=Prymnesium parvum TaxID=97485 RepID=A0AB34IQ59_PRYPA
MAGNRRHFSTATPESSLAQPRWHTVVAGGAAGAIDCCVTMPMDTMSTQMQLQNYRSPLECTKAIVQANGVRGLYAGFAPFCLQSAAKTSVRFFAFETLASAVDRCGVDRAANPGFWSLACGMGSGIIESLGLTAPTDRVKVMRQAEAARRGGECVTAVTLVREHGILTLYRGALATTLRQSSSVAVRFFCFGKIKAGLCSSLGCDEKRAPAWVSFLSGGIGGAVSVALNNPIDIAKSKIQAGVHCSISECIRETVKQRGLVGLGAGLSARLPRLFLSQAIQFMLVDVFKRYLQSTTT